MRRLLVAAGMLLLVVVLCITTLLSQTHQTRQLLQLLTQIESAFDAGEADTCETLAQSFAQEYQQRTRYFPFFIHHEEINKIGETAISLPVIARMGDDEHFSVELACCRHQLELLYQMELPTWENIF